MKINLPNVLMILTVSATPSLCMCSVTLFTSVSPWGINNFTTSVFPGINEMGELFGFKFYCNDPLHRTFFQE